MVRFSSYEVVFTLGTKDEATSLVNVIFDLEVRMRKRNIGFMAALVAVVVVASLMAFQPNTADAGPKKSDAQMDLMIELGTGPNGRTMSVQELTKLLSNIGSSGQDGFRVDSFFDRLFDRLAER